LERFQLSDLATKLDLVGPVHHGVRIRASL
jgi:hypothetical protein